MYRWAAALVFLVAALTDALDGYLARVRHEETKLGALLDPLADKALILSGLILLSRPSASVFPLHVPTWFVMLSISRDVMLILGGLIIHHTTGDFLVKPHRVGKTATLFQMILILWVILEFSAVPFPWLMGVAAVCTGISAALYIVDGARQLARTPHNVKPTQ